MLVYWSDDDAVDRRKLRPINQYSSLRSYSIHCNINTMLHTQTHGERATLLSKLCWFAWPKGLVFDPPWSEIGLTNYFFLSQLQKGQDISGVT